MLRLSDDLRFTVPVKINLNGLKADFKMHCRLIDSEKLDEMQKAQAEGRMTPGEFIAAWLVGWDDVIDDAGNPVPFNAPNLGRLVRLPYAPVAMVRAFYFGYEEATEGNSGPLPAGS